MREERKSRRSLLVMLALFCILMMLLIIFLRQTSDQDVREAVQGADKHKSQSTGAIMDWTKPRTTMARLTNAPPTVADSGSANENDTESNKNLDAPPSLDLPLSQGTIVSAIAVVDLDRIISSRPPADDSQAAREKVIQEIKAAVAARAVVHGYVLVINSSAKTLNRTPLILNEGRPDLTAEVLQELARSNVLTRSQ